MTRTVANESVDEFIRLFSNIYSTGKCLNLYRSDSPEGCMRVHNLREYLATMFLTSPKILLISEAPGYQGTKLTGTPFASEHPVLSKLAPMTNGTRYYIGPSNRTKPKKEPTSIIMCKEDEIYEHYA